MKNIEVNKLKDLADIISGVSIPSAERKNEGNWQLIRGRNIIENTVSESDIYIPDILAQKCVKATVVPGDILLSVMFEQYKVGIVPQIFPPALADRSVVIIRPKLINKEYLSNFLLSKTGRSRLSGQFGNMVRGSVIKFVTRRDVSELNIPILPNNLINNLENGPNITEKLSEIRERFEVEIVNSIKQFLLEKGWKENEISLEYKIPGNLRADIVLLREEKPIILLEIKKNVGNINLAQAQVQLMSNAIGAEDSYLITGDGIRKISKNGVENVDDLPSPKKGENGQL